MTKPTEILDPHTFAQEYEFRCDGGDYTPEDFERSMIEDAICSYLSHQEQSIPPANGIGSRELIASFLPNQKRQVQRIIQANLDAGTLVLTSDMRFIPAPARPPVQVPVVKAETLYRWRGPKGGWIYDAKKPSWYSEKLEVRPASPEQGEADV